MSESFRDFKNPRVSSYYYLEYVRTHNMLHLEASCTQLYMLYYVDTAPRVHKASLAATLHLTVSLVDPATRFDPGAHRMCSTEAGAAARRDRLQDEQIFLDRRGRDKPAVARRDKRNCAAGTWLSVFPNRLNGTSLSADEWRDNVRLRHQKVIAR